MRGLFSSSLSGCKVYLVRPDSCLHCASCNCMKKRSGGRSSKSKSNDHSLAIFRWSWTIFMVLLTSMPHLINWWRTPAGFQYTWVLPPYPEDSFGYLAWAEQAARGAWLFKIKFTALPHDAFLFHPLFLVCGWLGALLAGHLGVAFWVVKAIGVVFFFNVLYRYLDYLNLSRAESIVASVLTGISSGLGGILYLLGVQTRWAMMSTDLWMP